MLRRVFIIHGWEGSPSRDWMPWLAKELEREGFDAVVPAMPNPESPNFKEWLGKLKEEITNPDENTYVIGHSLGCITILRFLDSLKVKQKVGGVILVAGFGHDLEYKGYKGELKSFFDTPIDWSKIKTKANKFVVIHSKDDPWVPLEHNKIYRDKLEAQPVILDGFGHFSQDEGITKLPIVIEKLLGIAN